ncbi:MAG: thioredoxin family protein [Acidimicrobiia bacterium]
MAVTSTMLQLGTKAPDFTLRDTITGNLVSMSDYAGKKGLLVMFICNHCPYVQHVRNELARFGADYQSRDLGIVAISSNDPDVYPEDSPTAMKDQARKFGYTFPYLFDDDQSVAAAYTAMCTPDFFLFDDDRALVYRGRFDESRPNSGLPVTGADLRAAVEALLADHPIDEDQKPSMGCSIKWKDGNQPAYFRGG